MEVKLDTRPARQLTSREISKMMCGMLGCFTGWCDEDEIWIAMHWIVEHEDTLREMLKPATDLSGQIKAAAEAIVRGQQ